MVEVHPLRVWREENGVTLATLAGEVGVTPSHLSEIERGVNWPSLSLAARISRTTKKLRKPGRAGVVDIGDFAAREAAE